jgi:hypothetical protein
MPYKQLKTRIIYRLSKVLHQNLTEIRKILSADHELFDIIYSIEDEKFAGSRKMKDYE